jgi:NTP pyrophosphatase (non-canonical NTP hydrolase)
MNTNFKEYAEFSKRTRNPNLSINEQLCNYALGLCGEMAEIVDCLRWIDPELCTFRSDKRLEVLKEIGDVYWYLSQLVDLESKYAFDFMPRPDSSLNIEVKTLNDIDDIVNYSVRIACQIAELLKKRIFHKKINVVVLNQYHALNLNLRLICEIAETTEEEVLELNKKKLTERYPNGFPGQVINTTKPTLSTSPLMETTQGIEPSFSLTYEKKVLNDLKSELCFKNVLTGRLSSSQPNPCACWSKNATE